MGAPVTRRVIPCHPGFWAILFLLGALLLARPALAHKVNIFAYVDGEKVYSESYFPNGQPVVGARVQVFNSGGDSLLQGVTDADGRFDFALPGDGDMLLEVDAGMGHKNRFLLKNAGERE